MMMGTADEIVKAPEKDPVFIEDLTEEGQVLAVVRFLLCSVKFQESIFRYSCHKMTSMSPPDSNLIRLIVSFSCFIV